MDRSPPTRPTGVVRAVDPVGGPFAAATAVFAAVAAEGGSSSVFGRVAQEAARHAGGQAAVVRFDADTRCTVVAWPTASHRAWDSEIPPHWSQFADTTRRLDRAGQIRTQIRQLSLELPQLTVDD